MLNPIRYFFQKELRTRRRLRAYLKIKTKKNKSLKDRIMLSFLYDRLYIENSMIIAVNSHVSTDIYFPHMQNIVIGEGVRIGKLCTIFQDVTLGQNKGGYPVIGDNVIIYSGAKIIGNISIGNNAIIGANAVVVKDVSDNMIMGGIPAKVIGFRKEDDEFY
jgi:acetyltransferase